MPVTARRLIRRFSLLLWLTDAVLHLGPAASLLSIYAKRSVYLRQHLSANLFGCIVHIRGTTTPPSRFGLVWKSYCVPVFFPGISHMRRRFLELLNMSFVIGLGDTEKSQQATYSRKWIPDVQGSDYRSQGSLRRASANFTMSRCYSESHLAQQSELRRTGKSSVRLRPADLGIRLLPPCKVKLSQTVLGFE